MFSTSRFAITNALFVIMVFFAFLSTITSVHGLPTSSTQLEIAQRTAERPSNPANQPSSLLGRVYRVEARNDNLSSALVAKEANEEQWGRGISSDDESVLEFRPLARREKFHRRMIMKARMESVA
ncbi:hypothetical protein CVT24_012066 [Panaeolus cyanescens]|uniref:Uncharacterized protein n=1 Tax=Panaeolus cyanescens TaxID=181874 RepID=A0A409VHX4_9AGAR|nr:hypothetical protein CVT24_012066 [Panaeolus cyanescens]